MGDKLNIRKAFEAIACIVGEKEQKQITVVSTLLKMEVAGKIGGILPAEYEKYKKVGVPCLHDKYTQ